MNNMFENAKFGDKFITKDGKIGIFLSKDCHYAELVYEDGAKVKLHCSGKEQEDKENDYDIVKKWSDTQHDNDIDLVIDWFNHIAQMADDKKTANGFVMKDSDAFDEIKCLAKRCAQYGDTFLKTK